MLFFNQATFRVKDLQIDIIITIMKSKIHIIFQLTVDRQYRWSLNIWAGSFNNIVSNVM